MKNTAWNAEHLLQLYPIQTGALREFYGNEVHSMEYWALITAVSNPPSPSLTFPTMTKGMQDTLAMVTLLVTGVGIRVFMN